MKQEYRKIILGAQGMYYLLTGLWPLLHSDSFMELTGYKADMWLVKSVGFLLACSAVTFIIALFDREKSAAVVFLSVSCALALLSIDSYYGFTDEINAAYLIDALLQLLFIESWMLLFGRQFFRQQRILNQPEHDLIDR